MSRAIKCDRCGVCFDPDMVDDVLVKISDICWADKKQRDSTACDPNHRKYGTFESGVDLCADCTKLFSELLKGSTNYGQYE